MIPRIRLRPVLHRIVHCPLVQNSNQLRGEILRAAGGDDRSRAVAPDDLVGSGCRAADNRQPSPQVVEDARPHREIRFERGGKCQKCHGKAIVTALPLRVGEPGIETHEAAILPRFAEAHRFGGFALRRAVGVRVSGERDCHLGNRVPCERDCFDCEDGIVPVVDPSEENV